MSEDNILVKGFDILVVLVIAIAGYLFFVAPFIASIDPILFEAGFLALFLLAVWLILTFLTKK